MLDYCPGLQRADEGKNKVPMSGWRRMSWKVILLAAMVASSEGLAVEHWLECEAVLSVPNLFGPFIENEHPVQNFPFTFRLSIKNIGKTNCPGGWLEHGEMNPEGDSRHSGHRVPIKLERVKIPALAPNDTVVVSLGTRTAIWSGPIRVDIRLRGPEGHVLQGYRKDVSGGANLSWRGSFFLESEVAFRAKRREIAMVSVAVVSLVVACAAFLKRSSRIRVARKRKSSRQGKRHR